ncbi:transcriptional activator of the bfp operon [Escherichia coli]|uniref:PerA n=1 Tax=Escherichia coli TaxID=562 RepID=Q9F884_ECOLX|nr:BFP system transcriptional regulator PerA [Escherichia coli]AAG10692.1 PerA [Escherichia coli]ABM90566.1 PerA [Escherichia coli]ABM90568.1 PerA [Escherichia coli]STE09416.1 transcriptional activator of the bfp operon [Escherichia coli]STK53936.1 transcriptional activator of the bfp operon [Escherichia coli]
MLTSKKEMQSSENKQEENLALLLTNYISYQNIVIFTGGNQFKIRNKKEFTEYTIESNSLFFLAKNTHWDMEIVGIDNSNPYRKIIIDDALIKLLHSISSDDSCYVKKKIFTANLNEMQLNIVSNIITDIKYSGNNKKIFKILYLLSFFNDYNDIINVILSASSKSIVDRVIKVIELDISKNWKLGDVSSSMFMSDSCLRKQLNKENLTFKKIMLDIKMKHASLFLRTTDKNIDEISCLVGFNSTSYFIKVFKEYYNTTPKKYNGVYSITQGTLP